MIFTLMAKRKDVGIIEKNKYEKNYLSCFYYLDVVLKKQLLNTKTEL
jgi:hypothetical protein